MAANDQPDAAQEQNFGFQPRSLRQRLVLFVLLPVAVLLFLMGLVGFVFARNSLLTQWQEAAVLKLQRAAHRVDMRLVAPKEWLGIFASTLGLPSASTVQQMIIERLQTMEGVAYVNLVWEDPAPEASPRDRRHDAARGPSAGAFPPGGRSHPMHRGGSKAEIMSPRYDELVAGETVTLVAPLSDPDGKRLGRLEVALRFDYIIQDVLGSGSWQQGLKAFLVDDAGRVLTCTVPGGSLNLCAADDVLTRETLAAMQTRDSGTVLGRGLPPAEVSGFHRLQEAPWTLIVIAPGDMVLAPILRFRRYYAVTGVAFIGFVLVLIRLMTQRTVAAIKDVSRAAEAVARGDLGAPLPVRSRDEVGELTRSFNTMLSQLEERIRIKQALGLAQQVQQNLLPDRTLTFGNLAVAGASLYCEETGGDYFDFLQFPALGDGRLGIAVGDVVGHGVASALLMATVRALLRSRASQGGAAGRIVTDVNRLLCLDTAAAGNFMTLFFALLDPAAGEIRWARAGHEPALLYDGGEDSFLELRGTGMALGVDETQEYASSSYVGWSARQLLLFGTDGIWETENMGGERFGKKRLRQLLRENWQRSPTDILRAVTDAVAAFRRDAVQHDDITLVVVKFRPAAAAGD
ncbi:MAG: SpoIIE family protein phosphatase [Desulfobacteraceae bacterium]|nr:SpoIIE family protein phosphatase [Desulfobacteraceae bacterium]